MKRILAAAAFGLLAACETSTYANPMLRDDPSADYVSTSLTRIVGSPAEFMRADLDFDCVFNKANEDLYFPVYTPFTDEKFMSFSVWPPNSRLWDIKENSKKLVRTLYLRKDNPQVRLLLKLNRYERIHVYAGLKSHFENLPWMEVYYIDASGDLEFQHLSLALMVRAGEALKADRLAEATDTYQAALKSGVSSMAQKEVYSNLARAYTVKDPAKALWYYNEALSLDPGDETLQNEAKKLPTKQAKSPDQAEAWKMEVENLRGIVAQKIQENSEIQRKLDEAPKAQDVAALAKDRDTLAGQLGEAKSAAARLQTEMAQKTTMWTNKASDYEAMLNELKAKIDQGSKDAESRGKKLAELETQVAELKKAADMLPGAQKDLETSKAKIAELEKKLADAGSAADTKEDALKKLKAEFDTTTAQLGETIKKFRAENEDLQKKNAQLTEEIKKLKPEEKKE